MKLILQVPTETPPKDDKLADRVARRNPKVYEENYDPVVLEEWVRGIEKIFIVVEVPEEKKVNNGTYDLSGEADIWWNTVKSSLVGLEFTWSKFVNEFIPIIVPNCGPKGKGERVYGAENEWQHDYDVVC